MKNKVIFFVIAVLWTGIVGFGWYQSIKGDNSILSPITSFIQEPKETASSELPLAKYEYQRLKQRGGIGSQIVLEKELEKFPEFITYLFSYQSDGRKITGLLNMPIVSNKEKLPVIVMLRGYVDQEIYETGIGTKRAGEMYAKNGFITLAPDFLGYGESDMPPNNVWEERFLRLPCVMDLIASINSSAELNADSNKIGIWGHSNGGMIALSILEISGKPYPTTLWAPVSKYFPYDILYYTEEFEDKGKALRKSLAEFESQYNVDDYSFSEHLDWLKAPIIIHQGTADPYVPKQWSDDLAEKLKGLDVEISYYIYNGTDHNMNGAWDRVVERDLQFFKEELK